MVDEAGLRVEVSVARLVHTVEIVLVKRPLLRPLRCLQHLLRADLPAWDTRDVVVVGGRQEMKLYQRRTHSEWRIIDPLLTFA